MALTPCRECGAEISDQAAACPSCGAPTLAAEREAWRRGNAYAIAIAVAIMAVVIGLVAWHVHKDHQRAQCETSQLLGESC